MSAGMNLVFIIYSYFPHGGQQRDFMRILNECRARGHNITVYTLKWTGDKPDGVIIHLAPVKALTRTRLYKKFTRWFENHSQPICLEAMSGYSGC